MSLMADSSGKPNPQSPERKVATNLQGQRNADLIDRIKESADQLADDRSSRGDLKLLSRTLRELRYAFKVFAPFRRRRKVTVFGSARTPAEHPSYVQAVQFGKQMAERDWLVVTGAASGIMEAGHLGAGRDHSMGLNIMLPFEQEANPIIAGDHKLVHMKYFFTRKVMFVKECDAVVCLPGGFGTLDEALEVLTLLQTGKRDMVPVVLLDQPGGTYWSTLDRFIREQLLQHGMISDEDLSLYCVTDSCDRAVDEVLRFFRVFHSMRYVRDQLVLRLQRELDADRLRAIGERFADIVVSGGFRVGAALDVEKSEVDLIELPRLMFAFNRRSLGRLRQLIDFINASD
ncbi:MAG: TIGR00730 family Rossman fold protein [Planctomycetaceae bacterium]|nr:TIGR00730 family Rossman fold protein [Planctomycetaceae bacterium]